MEQFKRIRFVAANYSSLHGLKYVPMGLLAILMSLWGSTLRNPATDLTFPILIVAACGALYWAIDRYYAHTFGHIGRSNASVRLEWLIQIAGSVLALAAFAVDVSLRLPVSTLGLVLAAVFLADYLRMTRFMRDRFLGFYPLLAVLMIGLSVLPLVGPADWWQAFGVKSPVLGVLLIYGLLVVIVGILIHLFLVKSLPPAQESNHA